MRAVMLAALALASGTARPDDAVLLSGASVYRDSGSPLVRAAVLIQKGRIAFIGPEAEAEARLASIL